VFFDCAYNRLLLLCLHGQLQFHILVLSRILSVINIRHCSVVNYSLNSAHVRELVYSQLQNYAYCELYSDGHQLPW